MNMKRFWNNLHLVRQDKQDSLHQVRHDKQDSRNRLRSPMTEEGAR